ncbi:Hsp33 family molecular chaperone HslO [Anaerosacchariphilus polymeriproducens]|uniref:33 kDa chaperonin n=1 Tax=Anaerosacchariphilus polymeriproducens TaxID=1812858 RepID=A0A371AWN0_9FIRM|nr:Hsp33 family molecular chaperone HslO [Anaerosacchariphilus polymeriproducens]RDU23951.1 Hsp33 family molecular chaperone HslO [Anaerosacchariphilus polymeriproducens]
MSDYIVRATAANNQIRIFAATTKETVEKARIAHNTSPVATAALGRLLTAGAIMGTMMKGDKDILTLQIKGSGPIEGITVTADSKGNVKGYVNEPNVLIPANNNGKLDVAGAVGEGILNVIKDMGMKEPYVGQTVLQTSEIAEDLTFYFANSEQIPSSVGLGVLMEKDNTVKQAGGFILQLMPFAEESVVEYLEESLKNITSVTTLLEQGYTPEQLVEKIAGDLGVEIMDNIPTRFYCNCSKDRISKAIISIGKEETQNIIDEGKPIEVKCHFCNTNYVFEIDELKELLK